MEHIIGWDYVAVEYARLFQASVDFTLAHIEYLSELADAVCYKFKGLCVHGSEPVAEGAGEREVVDVGMGDADGVGDVFEAELHTGSD